MAYSSEVYEMSGAKKALMLCAASPKEGGDSDMRIMRCFFRQFRFGGYGENIIPNATAREMREHIQRFRNNIMRDQQDISCILVSVSCHGNLTHLAGIDKETIQVREIIKTFSDENCPKLKGKPKIFILDACRGHPDREQISDKGVYRFSRQQKPTKEDKEISELRNKHASPVISDMFTVYPTMSGYTAGCTTNGGFLHENIEEVFLKGWSFNRGNHLADLFYKVNRKLLESNEMHTSVVSLVVESTLRKFVYLE